MPDIRAIVLEHLPCWCVDAYKDRNLSQPDCPRCNFADDLIEDLELAMPWWNQEPTDITMTIDYKPEETR